MRTALLVALAPDLKSGHALTDVLPYDQAKAQFKDLCEAGVALDPAYPVLQIWAGTVKTRRLKGSLALPDTTAASTDAGEGDLLGEGGATGKGKGR